MSAYGYLADLYDSLTGDVPYGEFADYYESIFNKSGKSIKTVLDLACGTGTMACLLASRGYEIIATDASEEMLSVASEKIPGLVGCTPPFLLCQNMAELDLFGTVDAAICCLDGMNYALPEDLSEIFRRLALFIEPEGILVFDVHTPERLRSLDGQIFSDENEDMLCIWRASFDEDENALFYDMDIFVREGHLWRRQSEEHIEYAHELPALSEMLAASGFKEIKIRTDCPQNDLGRVFITAINGRIQK